MMLYDIRTMIDGVANKSVYNNLHLPIMDSNLWLFNNFVWMKPFYCLDWKIYNYFSFWYKQNEVIVILFYVTIMQALQTRHAFNDVSQKITKKKVIKARQKTIRISLNGLPPSTPWKCIDKLYIFLFQFKFYMVPERLLV